MCPQTVDPNRTKIPTPLKGNFVTETKHLHSLVGNNDFAGARDHLDQLKKHIDKIEEDHKRREIQYKEYADKKLKKEQDVKDKSDALRQKKIDDARAEKERKRKAQSDKLKSYKTKK